MSEAFAKQHPTGRENLNTHQLPPRQRWPAHTTDTNVHPRKTNAHAISPSFPVVAACQTERVGSKLVSEWLQSF